jgi:hypothetical protein
MKSGESIFTRISRMNTHRGWQRGRSNLERFNKSGNLDWKSVGSFREVLDCGHSLPQSKTLARHSTA